MSLIRRSPLRRGTKPLKRTAIRRIGKRGIKGAEARRQARELYFGGRQWAPCQVCGLPMQPGEADAAHKLKRSLKAGDGPERVLIVHGHRCGPVNCHAWLDQEGKQERRDAVKTTPKSAVNGGVMLWGQLQEELESWLNGTSTGQAAFYWSRSGRS